MQLLSVLIILCFAGLVISGQHANEKSLKEIIAPDEVLFKATQEVEIVHIVYMCHLGNTLIVSITVSPLS